MRRSPTRGLASRIDLIAPFGTQVVAAHPGNVTYSSSYSGGLQAYVYGSGGYSFYAHLSGYSGAGGSVGAGTVIGYVGSTGTRARRTTCISSGIRAAARP